MRSYRGHGSPAYQRTKRVNAGLGAASQARRLLAFRLLVIELPRGAAQLGQVRLIQTRSPLAMPGTAGHLLDPAAGQPPNERLTVLEGEHVFSAFVFHGVDLGWALKALLR